jgi:hypothetical protein
VHALEQVHPTFATDVAVVFDFEVIETLAETLDGGDTKPPLVDALFESLHATLRWTVSEMPADLGPRLIGARLPKDASLDRHLQRLRKLRSVSRRPF